MTTAQSYATHQENPDKSFLERVLAGLGTYLDSLCKSAA